MTDYSRPELYAPLRRPVEQALTLIPESYFAPEFFAQERERVWRQSWVAVGYQSQVPQAGDVLPVEVAGQPLFVVRDREGRIRAFYNVCRHRGSRLIDSAGNGKVIRCPYHGWGYSLEGRLLGTPYFQGLDVPPELAGKFQLEPAVARSFCKEDYPLLPVHTETWAGIIFVNLSERPLPFREWLGDLPGRYARHPLDQLQLVRRQAYEIHANWKLIAENFMEYYHLPFGHPELCNVSGFDNHWRYQGPGMYTGMCTSPLTSDAGTVSFEGLPVWGGLTFTESQSAYFVLLFPNIALWIFPHHLVTLLFRPQDAGVSLEYLDMLVHPRALEAPDIDATLDRVMSFWRFVNDQDVRLVERVQAGVISRSYHGGRMCFKFEEPVHRFQNMVADLMTGQWRVPPGDAHEEAPRLEPAA
ncbi:MAG: aromatic ring-hydroxylating oxygenase subunit alpha, partial [Planctomycetaceae bacterium]